MVYWNVIRQKDQEFNDQKKLADYCNTIMQLWINLKKYEVQRLYSEDYICYCIAEEQLEHRKDGNEFVFPKEIWEFVNNNKLTWDQLVNYKFHNYNPKELFAIIKQYRNQIIIKSERINRVHKEIKEELTSNYCYTFPTYYFSVCSEFQQKDLNLLARTSFPILNSFEIKTMYEY